MKKRWIKVTFDNCPECGDEPEIFSDTDDENYFYDGDPVRCQSCGWGGQFVTDGDEEGPSYIDWNDEPPEDHAEVKKNG